KQVKYQYDRNGDLVAVTDQEKNVTHLVYGEPRRAHYLTEVIDPLGRTAARTEYNDQGRLVKMIDGAGRPVEVIYDPGHSVQTIRDGLGNPSAFEYDGRGNVVTVVAPDGGVTRMTYDTDNNMLSTTDPVGRVTSFTYDARGNLLTRSDPHDPAEPAA